MKWWMCGLIVLLVSLVCCSYALAGIDEYRTTIDLNYNSSKMRLSLVVNGGEHGIRNTHLPFSFNPQNIIVYSDEGIMEHKLTMVEEGYILSIIHEIPKRTTKRIYVEFEHKESVTRIGDNYLFGFGQKIPENIKKFEVLIKLPEGAVLANLTEMSPVSPEPNTITSDGRRIIMNWVKTNVSQAEDFRIIAAFERTGIEESTSPFFLSLIFSMGLSFVIIPLLYLFFKKKESKILAVGLDKEEKRIYDFVLLKKQTKQKIIQRELDMSKARLSKLLKKLEEKELIEKQVVGRTNLIKIKNRGFNPLK